jgi:hypothetical protein
MIELLVLEDQVLLNMARNPNFLREFPVLKPIANPQAGVATMVKSCCNGGAPRAVANMNAIKYAITQLPQERKKVLLQMLGARQVRVVLSISGRITNYNIAAA